MNVRMLQPRRRKEYKNASFLIHLTSSVILSIASYSYTRIGWQLLVHCHSSNSQPCPLPHDAFILATYHLFNSISSLTIYIVNCKTFYSREGLSATGTHFDTQSTLNIYIYICLFVYFSLENILKLFFFLLLSWIGINLHDSYQLLTNIAFH